MNDPNPSFNDRELGRLGRPASWSPVGDQSRRTDPDDAPVPTDPFSCLREVDLFADLSPAEMDAMDRMAPAALFRRGQILYSQAEQARSLFILKTGGCGSSELPKTARPSHLRSWNLVRCSVR